MLQSETLYLSSLHRSSREAAVWMIETVWLIWACCTTVARLERRALVSILTLKQFQQSWTVKATPCFWFCIVCFVVFLPLYIIRHQFVFCYTPSLFLCCLGDADAAASFARQLLGLGADPNLRSRWTNMRALHYAAYFDVPQLIQVVLQASQPGGEEMPSARVVSSSRRRRRSLCTETVQFSCSSTSNFILPDKRAFNECVSICCQIIKLMLMPCVNGGTLKQFYCIKTSIGVPQTCFLLLIFQELAFLKSSCFCWISFLVLRRQTRVCRWCIWSFSVYRGGRHLQWLWFRNGSAHRCIQLVSVSRQMPPGAGSKPCFQSEFHCSHTQGCVSWKTEYYWNHSKTDI